MLDTHSESNSTFAQTPSTHFPPKINSYLEQAGFKQESDLPIASKAQYGFQKGQSLEQALLHVKDEIMKKVEEKNLTLGLFLDLRKTLDSINPTILLNKLGESGIRALTNKSIETYLNTQNRFYALQKLKVRFFNNSARCTSGVRIGTPNLFGLY